jgi:uncharacterized protein
MPIKFNVRHVEQNDLELVGETPVEELELELRDDLLHPGRQLKYDLSAQLLDGGVLVQGSLRLDMQYECVRCLTPFKEPLEITDWTCHLPLAGEDAVPVNNDVVDLTPYIREDILLALPQHPLCKPDCGGLEVPASVKDPGKESGQSPSAWDELNKLKL